MTERLKEICTSLELFQDIKPYSSKKSLANSLFYSGLIFFLIFLLCLLLIFLKCDNEYVNSIKKISVSIGYLFIVFSIIKRAKDEANDIINFFVQKRREKMMLTDEQIHDLENISKILNKNLKINDLKKHLINLDLILDDNPLSIEKLLNGLTIILTLLLIPMAFPIFF